MNPYCGEYNVKVGIVSEFKLDTINFGNQLQAYALNYFLRNHLGIENVESIALGAKQMGQHTKVCSVAFAWKVLNTLWMKITAKFQAHREQKAIGLRNRLQKFRDFQEKNIPVCNRQFYRDEIRDTDYDAIIVGSDVVWSQYPLWISRTKFLDFDAKRPFRRIAYAASFGRDYIPEENVRFLCKYLARFDAISVRERSSVAMLNRIGIQNVSYCLDPTLLLTEREWERLEEKPDEVGAEKYIFTYLLGRSARQRKEITAFAEKAGLKIVTIPHANGYFVEADEAYGDIRLHDSSIGNWLWLIHHAEYVITDSFHGTVFSTIYQNRFVVLAREGTVDINNRMQDYLREVEQSDKVLPEGRLSDIENLVWDYVQIGAAIEVRRQSSIGFLKDALG